MIVILKPNAAPEKVQELKEQLQGQGLEIHSSSRRARGKAEAGAHSRNFRLVGVEGGSLAEASSDPPEHENSSPSTGLGSWEDCPRPAILDWPMSKNPLSIPVSSLL